MYYIQLWEPCEKCKGRGYNQYDCLGGGYQIDICLECKGIGKKPIYLTLKELIRAILEEME